MKKVYIYGLLAVLATLGLASCSEDVLPNTSKPSLTLNVPSEITRNTATVTGSISINGSAVKESAFMYSTAQSDLTVSSTSAKKNHLSVNEGSVSTTFTGLESGTTYYYCLYITSGISSMISDIKTFTTASIDPPTLRAVEIVGAVEPNTITVKSAVLADGGDDLSEMGFEYKKTTENNFKTEPVADVELKVETEFTLSIRGLDADTDYEIRAYARNKGTTDKGTSDVLAVKTERLIGPGVTTVELAEGNAGSTWIKVSGRVESFGEASSILEKGFCYSETNQNPTMADNTLEVSGETEEGKQYTGTITGLKPNTTYYIRAYATNQVNGRTREGYGDPITVTTRELTDEDRPQMDIQTSQDKTTYTITGTVTSNEIPITEVGVCWTNNRDIWWDIDRMCKDSMKAVELSEDGGFSVEITDLQIGTEYLVCVYASNEAGRSESWHTVSLDYGKPNIQHGDTKTSAGAVTVTGTVTVEEYPVTEIGICWTTDVDMWDRDKAYEENHAIGSVAEDNSYTITATGLEMGKAYYYWIYAKNAVGTSWWGRGGFNLFVPTIDEMVSPGKQ